MKDFFLTDSLKMLKSSLNLPCLKQEIEKKWNNEGWKKKSKLDYDNRLAMKSETITKHTVGSITIATHKPRLHEKLGKPPTSSQLFERVQRRNKGEGDFTDNKSRIVWEKYDTAIHENMVQMCHNLKLTLKHGVKQLKVLVMVIAFMGLVLNEIFAQRCHLFWFT